MSAMIAFVVAVCVSIIITPISARLARKIGAVDYPSRIKIHDRPTPRLGGIGILAGIAVVYALPLSALESKHISLMPVLLGSIVVTFVGALDDARNLTPIQKLIGEAAAAITYVVFRSPVCSTSVVSMMSESITILVLTISLTNSVNLMDGLDGLLGGAFIPISIAGAWMASGQGRGDWAVLLVSVAGSCCGFLPYNLPPAKTFMGDSGSLLLGFIASMAIYELTFRSIIPTYDTMCWMLMLALPIVDTLMAIVRRGRNRCGISTGDRKHIYDQVCKKLNGSVLKTDMMALGFMLLTSGLAILMNRIRNWHIALAVLIATYATLIACGARFGSLDSE